VLLLIQATPPQNYQSEEIVSPPKTRGWLGTGIAIRLQTSYNQPTAQTAYKRTRLLSLSTSSKLLTLHTISTTQTNSIMATPTVVIVPGSFAPSKHYRVFTDSLERHGIDSRVIDTPSVGKRGNLPPATMSDDAEEITNLVSKLLDEGKEVVLMTHSYGGIPGTQSLSKLSRKAREAEGKKGGVDKIIYLASVVLQPGVSNLDAFGSALPGFLDLKVDFNYFGSRNLR
jgi:pimeloyl-ACP methyl ester carboxylesterase